MRKKYSVILIISIIVIVALVFVSSKYIGNNKETIGILSKTQWDKPQTVNVTNPFNSLKLNPFKK